MPTTPTRRDPLDDFSCRVLSLEATPRTVYVAGSGPALPGAAANPEPPPFFRDVVGTPHSVVTAHFVDEAGHPTVQARDEILAYLERRLRP